MMPVGHAAIYLDHVSADGPLHLRACDSGEPQGVVLARYHRLGRYDWIASPVLEFLYAAERPEDIPATVTSDSVWEMRQRYRRRFLSSIVPDGAEHDRVTDEWWESAGVAYNRRLWAYSLATTPQQDQQFIATMNARENRHLYHLKKTNCADFAAEMVNHFFPHAVHNDRIADFGLMTPKQVARSVDAYGNAHPETGLRIFEVPQVSGTLRRSKPVRGGAEAGLKTRRYLFTLLVIQPEVPACLAVLYLWHGRWQIGKGAEPVDPSAFINQPSPAFAGTGPAMPSQPASGSATNSSR